MQTHCNLIEDTKQNVVFLLRRRRYVDDMAKSLRTENEREKLMSDTDEALGMFNMKVKGYCESGKNPPEDCTKDNVSVTVIGYRWYPKMDLFSIKMAPTNFEQKKRGRLDPSTKFFGIG